MSRTNSGGLALAGGVLATRDAVGRGARRVLGERRADDRGERLEGREAARVIGDGESDDRTGRGGGDEQVGGDRGKERRVGERDQSHTGEAGGEEDGNVFL